MREHDAPQALPIIRPSLLKLSTCFMIFAGLALPQVCLSQTSEGTLPVGTPFTLRSSQPASMKVGAPVQAELMYDIYAENQLVLRAGTKVIGTVTTLRSDHARRVRASLGGDMTPFKIPTVRFNGLILPDGSTLSFSAGDAIDGAAVYRAIAPAPVHGGFIGQQFHSLLTVARNDVALFIAPGKVDRLRQLIYSQLPYHPQRIDQGTAWTVETTEPLQVPAEPAPTIAATPKHKPHFWEPREEEPIAPMNTEGSAWIIEAYLQQPLSSETSKQGEPIRAVVAQPVYDAQHAIAVPEGSTLEGTVTRAKPARRFGRTGVLSFNFQQLTFPETGRTQTVETRLTQADSAANIALNSEGQAKSKPQDKVSVPLLLALMASRPLDQDRGHSNDVLGQTGKNGVGGAAGLGLVGTIVGMAGGSPYFAAGIGYWGMARSVFSRWIAHGQTIRFAKDTRIVVETTPRRSAPIKATSEPR